MCPTRELARQVHSEFVRMAGKSAARAALIYGGVSMNDQYDALARHPHVVIGTPGRVIDHMKRGTLDLSRLHMAVLDEGDQMLDIGFLPDIEYILKHTHHNAKPWCSQRRSHWKLNACASATAKTPTTYTSHPNKLLRKKWTRNFIAVDQDKKDKLLEHFIQTHKPEQLVVFCRTKSKTDRVVKVLKRKKCRLALFTEIYPKQTRKNPHFVP